MARTKLRKFAEIGEMENVFVDPVEMKGKWGDVVLELACGAGDYAVALAQSCPERKFVGVDRKGDRIWVGAKKALGLNCSNVAFLHGQIAKLGEYFGPGEVSEIWITFPDPYEKPSKHKQRLTSERFLDVYKGFLKKGGVVHLKTDHLGLFNYTLGVIKARGLKVLEKLQDVHGGGKIDDELQILTHYEGRFLAEGRPIYYLKFKI
ncbi:tRNA (guanosine(46)-N7)-methyltransferase TrmB [Patescibacteria group bacterium]|nr:tRNA (guanosine(46)-N7)-methyltransferase TrmB [Patescibacteria group bacterium]